MSGVRVYKLGGPALEDPGLRQHLAGPGDQELQQRELPRGQLDGVVGAPDLVGRRVQPQVPGGKHGRALALPAPQQGAQPGDEHHERERF